MTAGKDALTARLTVASTPEHRAPRVCMVTEDMGPPLDEGIKKFAVLLHHALAPLVPTLAISTAGPLEAPHTLGLRAGRLFISPKLSRYVRAFDPHVLCYISSASDTLFSFLRLRVLKASGRHALTVLVALQPRPHTELGTWLMRRVAPDLLLVQSRRRAVQLKGFGCAVRWLPSGVDTERFVPVSPQRRRALRMKYGLPPDSFIVLHVGHITPERNVALLAEAQRRWQVVLVTGNSVGQDMQLRRMLEAVGVIIIDRYLDAVQEVYQAADCFLFPVSDEWGSIETPLSVLEAMACNLPVVSTRFGGLTDLLGTTNGHEDAGLFLADTPSHLLDLVAEVHNGIVARTRALAEPLSWDLVASRFLYEVTTALARSSYDR